MLLRPDSWERRRAGLVTGIPRRFGPGTILKVEDTTGKGHTSRVIGNKETLAGIVQLE